VYEKNILENQLVHYKETVKRISEKQLDLEQQLRNSMVGGEKGMIQVRNTMQREFDLVSEARDRTISEKTHLVNSLES
jgi:hypothetical protein